MKIEIDPLNNDMPLVMMVVIIALASLVYLGVRRNQIQSHEIEKAAMEKGYVQKRTENGSVLWVKP